MLGIEYPILLAGMGSSSGPTLAAAVSNAGGFGVLGAAGMSPDEVRRWIKKTKNLTDKPFGLDLILPHEISSELSMPKNVKDVLPPEHVAFVEDLMEELGLPEVGTKDFWSRITMEVAQEVVQICIEEGLALFVSGLGNPGWAAPDAHKKGMLVAGCVGGVFDRGLVAGGTGPRRNRGSAADGVGYVSDLGSDSGGGSSGNGFNRSVNP